MKKLAPFLTRREAEEEMQDFLESWKDAMPSYPHAFVPARLLNVTGNVLRHLVERGMVETNGAGYKPMPRF